MAIKAYNAGTNNNLIDTSERFEEGDMLVFDKSKNLFTKGITLGELARKGEVDGTYASKQFVEDLFAKRAYVDDIFPTKEYVDGRFDALSDSDHQQLSLNDFVLSISNGNNVDLGPLLNSYPTKSELTEAIAQAQIDGGDGDVDLSSYVTNVELTTALANYQPTIDLSNYVTNNALTAYYTKTDVDNLIPTPFSGDYNDLTNKPTIPTTFSGDYNDLVNKPNIPQTFFSGDYNDLINKPTTFSGNYNDLYNQPTIPSIDGLATEAYVNNAVSGVTVDLSGYYTKPEVDALIPTPFSGDYNDLTNKPSAPDLSSYATTVYVDTQIASALSGGSIDLSSYVTEAELTTALANYQPTIDLTEYYTKTEVDALIPTPFSGDYADLTNKPTIPHDVNQLSDADGLLNNIDLSNYATTAYVTNQLGSYQPLTDLSVYALKTDVFSKSWNDITDKPVLFSGDFNDLINKPNVFSGNYNDLYNQPIIPSIDGLASVSYVDQQIANVSGGGSIDLSSYVTETELATELSNYQPVVDLSGYATETYVNQQISNASLVGASNLDDLNDVAVGSLPQQVNSSEHYLLEYNPVNQLWESKDFGSIFATQQYVTETVATIVTDGDINLDGYATEQFVEQKLTELPAPFSGDYFDLANRPILFSGDYNDLINTPAGNNDLRMQLVGQELQLINIEPEPDTIISRVSLDSLGDAIAANISYNDIADLPNLFSGDYGDLVNRPQLFSGNYADLRNKPYIPSIAGLATEEYVDNRWAEPEITGDRFFTHDLVVKESNLDSHTAQKRMTAFAIQTTNNTPTQVVDSNGDPLTFAPNTTVMIEVSIVAAGVDVSDNAATKHKGIVTVDNTNAQFVGIVAQEILEMGSNGWTSTIYTNDNGGRQLHIEVTGSASHTVNWTVFIESYEVVNL